MGCFGSRMKKNEEYGNYYTQAIAFIGGGEGAGGEPDLSPIDKLEWTYKVALPEGTYGTWDEKKIKLNDELELVEGSEFVDSACTQVIKGLDAQANFLRKSSGIAKD